MTLDLLHSSHPAKDRAEAMQLYGQLTGKWQIDIRYIPVEGAERFASGEWEFGYALEGRAVIDIWQVPAREVSEQTGKSVECGLCVRVYDPVLALWKFTFHGPLYRTTLNMLAYQIGNEIVQEMFVERDIVRWIFHNITPETFSWKAIRSKDGGKSWRVEQIVQASRII
ncbi:hypothetical protein QNI16_19875 [Cytophagaceae bacterium YF14B1]|uniref:Uncharacterized protein n=1 Tax=Xanthocytophaga flava TaxID=3048013 RepID=A0AAE3QTY1_9BACT|nr:hypothetical protein [Xanthocytophaga flavus]MDJ1482769.1 hypothetical protein [Xanthocytophaga flavus]